MRIALIGIQGSGKSTQAFRLGEKLSLPVISLGGILREGIEANDSFVTDWYTRENIDEGLMAPDHLVKAVLKRESDHLESFIIEGFSRTVAQAQFLVENIGIDFVIDIDISEKCAISRLTSRGRSDDSDEGIRNRIHAYWESIEEIREALTKVEKFSAINGEQSEDGVTNSLISLVKKS